MWSEENIDFLKCKNRIIRSCKISDEDRKELEQYYIEGTNFFPDATTITEIESMMLINETAKRLNCKSIKELVVKAYELGQESVSGNIDNVCGSEYVSYEKEDLLTDFLKENNL